MSEETNTQEAIESEVADSTPQIEAASPETIEGNVKEYLLKVNGKERNVKLDLSNEEEVRKYLQKAIAADEQFQHAAEVKKAAMEFIEELKKNPRRVLTDPSIGIDVKQFAEAILNEEITQLQKTPEQIERERLEAELLDLRTKAKDQAEAAQRAEIARLQSEQERVIESEIQAVLEAGGIPKTARTVKQMAELMLVGLQNGIDLSTKDIAQVVKKNVTSDFKEIIESLSDDQLELFLGRDVITRLRRKSIAKAKAITTANQIADTGSRKAEPEEPKKQTIKEFFGV
jgi:hypothetical protein